MAISVFPTPAAVSSIAKTVVAPGINNRYQAVVPLDTGTYVVSCVSSVVASFEFVGGDGSVIASGSTTSGTVTVNLATPAAEFHYWITSGTDVIISIALTGVALTTTTSGVRDVITASTTYTGTGQVYVVAVGAGGGGGTGPGDGGGGATFDRCQPGTRGAGQPGRWGHRPAVCPAGEAEAAAAGPCLCGSVDRPGGAKRPDTRRRQFGTQETKSPGVHRDPAQAPA